MWLMPGMIRLLEDFRIACFGQAHQIANRGSSSKEAKEHGEEKAFLQHDDMGHLLKGWKIS